MPHCATARHQRSKNWFAYLCLRRRLPQSIKNSWWKTRCTYFSYRVVPSRLRRYPVCFVSIYHVALWVRVLCFRCLFSSECTGDFSVFITGWRNSQLFFLPFLRKLKFASYRGFVSFVRNTLVSSWLFVQVFECGSCRTFVKFTWHDNLRNQRVFSVLIGVENSVSAVVFRWLLLNNTENTEPYS